MTASNPLAVHASLRAFFAQLVASGVQHVALSPGSRSTPLTVAADQTPGLDVSIHLDERAGSFFALGLARATKQPVALVCTSGTAAANYLPAVIEAFHSGVPLLVLTADRPPELQSRGAPQTIDQVELFGTHVRWFHQPAVAGTEHPSEAVALAAAAVQLAHDWGVPSLGGAFSMGSSEPGSWQHGRDSVYTALFTPLVGADFAERNGRSRPGNFGVGRIELALDYWNFVADFGREILGGRALAKKKRNRSTLAVFAFFPVKTPNDDAVGGDARTPREKFGRKNDRRTFENSKKLSHHFVAKKSKNADERGTQSFENFVRIFFTARKKRKNSRRIKTRTRDAGF